MGRLRVSRRRAWNWLKDHSAHDRDRITLINRKCAGRPGFYPRVSARIWCYKGLFDMVAINQPKSIPRMQGTRMTPEELSKSGSEHGHQRALFQEIMVWSPIVYEHTFAIPNGGKRGDTARSSMIRGGQLKAEGVKAGVPDVMVAWPVSWPDGTAYAGLFLEMKRPADRDKDRRAGSLGKAQEPWHDKLRARGYAVAIAYSWDEGLAAIKCYFRAG